MFAVVSLLSTMISATVAFIASRCLLGGAGQPMTLTVVLASTSSAPYSGLAAHFRRLKLKFPQLIKLLKR